MSKLLDSSIILEAASAFAFAGEPTEQARYSSGHINDTFLVRCVSSDKAENKYILQRINQNVFKNPEQVIKNISNITDFLAKKIKKEGGDSVRGALRIIQTKDGGDSFKDNNGGWWRAYNYIEGTVCLDKIETPEQFYQSAVAFGRFQSQLSDYPAHTLYETIPDFHNTPDRFRKFKEAVEKDICDRANEVSEEIRFYMERESFCHVLMDALNAGELPLRVTHNDTKLNNVMLDEITGEPVCVIDLDTVMPGFSVTDFGDSIRYGASTGEEDERDLSMVNLDLSLFDIYTKGYLLGCGGRLTDKEMELLPTGAKMMTLECGMRFLTDYLEGDTYFRIHRDKQNLDRSRTHIKLVQDMEANWDKLAAIVAKYK